MSNEYVICEKEELGVIADALRTSTGSDKTYSVSELSTAASNMIKAGGGGGVSPTAKVEQTSTGAIISITDVNGTTTAAITNGKNGTSGTSVTINSISESSEDGGNNVVSFSNGKTLTIKNGSAGSPGQNGYTP